MGRILVLLGLLVSLVGSVTSVGGVTNVPWICNDDATLPPYSQANVQNTILGPVIATEKKGELFYSKQGGIVRSISVNASLGSAAGNGDLKITLYPFDPVNGPLLSNPLASINKSAAGVPVGAEQLTFSCQSPLGYQNYILSNEVYLGADQFYFLTAEIIGSPKSRSWYWWANSGQADTLPYSYPWLTNSAGTNWTIEDADPTTGVAVERWDYQFGIVGDPGATPPNHWLINVEHTIDLNSPLGDAVYMLMLGGLFLFMCLAMKVPILPTASLLFLATLVFMKVGLIAPPIVLTIIVFASLILVVGFISSMMNRGSAESE